MRPVQLALTICTLSLSVAAQAQFVAKMEVKEPIDGVCNNDGVYVLFPGFDGQVPAQGPLTKEEIQARLDEGLAFLNENPKFKGEGMIGLIVNCKGELVQCNMDNKTKSAELDRQIEDVFRTLTTWTPGKLNGRAVDTSILYSFKIKGGKLVLN